MENVMKNDLPDAITPENVRSIYDQIRSNGGLIEKFLDHSSEQNESKPEEETSVLSASDGRSDKNPDKPQATPKATLTKEQIRSLFPPATPQHAHFGDAVMITATPGSQMIDGVKSNPTAVVEQNGPSFTSGLNHAQVTALAEETKEKLQQQSEDRKNVPLYDQFDDTLMKLLEEIQNSDVLSTGQKAALFMKVHMQTSVILKESYEVNV